ncbi:hypothetical protein GOODEAATRI_001798 [Goodea atripinnis]|uniref:Uncharacterized protein n=1 Tax=Goodea atripinnis TaxID=208336 RepID=A0ABV0PAK1_9TELE
MKASRKCPPYSGSFPQTLRNCAGLILVYVSLLAADRMTDKTVLPDRERSLKGREERMVVAARRHGMAEICSSPFTMGVAV